MAGGVEGTDGVTPFQVNNSRERGVNCGSGGAGLELHPSTHKIGHAHHEGCWFSHDFKSELNTLEIRTGSLDLIHAECDSSC